MDYTITTSDGLDTLHLENISDSIQYGRLNLIKETVITFDREFFISVIGLNGTFDIRLTENSKPTLCDKGSVLVHADKKDCLSLCARNSEGFCLLIVYKTDFLDLLKKNPLHKPEVRNIIVDQPVIKVLTNQYIKILAADLIGNKLPPSVSHIHCKAKVLEVFALQLDELISTPEPSSLNIRDDDMKKIRMVRQLIEENTGYTYTISELARYAGTNEQYLKKFFKHFYGKTIYNYMLGCKMEKARDLILKRGAKIANVAQQTGYKYPTHFSAAFKRYFGYLPQSLKYLVIIQTDLEWLLVL